MRVYAIDVSMMRDAVNNVLTLIKRTVQTRGVFPLVPQIDRDQDACRVMCLCCLHVKGRATVMNGLQRLSIARIGAVVGRVLQALCGVSFFPMHGLR